MLWERFTTVVMLNEQVHATRDPQLQRLLMRIREGIAVQRDVELSNRTCYQECKRAPWETGISVVMTLNKKSMEVERRRNTVVSKAAQGRVKELHIRTQMERWPTDRRGGPHHYGLRR